MKNISSLIIILTLTLLIFSLFVSEGVFVNTINKYLTCSYTKTNNFTKIFIVQSFITFIFFNVFLIVFCYIFAKSERSDVVVAGKTVPFKSLTILACILGIIWNLITIILISLVLYEFKKSNLTCTAQDGSTANQKYINRLTRSCYASITVSSFGLLVAIGGLGFFGFMAIKNKKVKVKTPPVTGTI
jgi:hypothetical protein